MWHMWQMVKWMINLGADAIIVKCMLEKQLVVACKQ